LEKVEKTMSVFKRKGSSTYSYDFWFQGHRYHGGTNMTNREAARRAEASLKLKLAERRFGIVRRGAPPSFAELAPSFLERVQLERKPKTHALYQSIVNNNLLPVFGPMLVDEITAESVNAFKQDRLRDGRQGTTVNRDLAVLRRILSLAVKDGLLDSSPFMARRIEFLPENRCERVLSFAEEKKYLKVASPLLRDFATIILEMGLRPEEVFALHSLHVHLAAFPAYVHISNGKTSNARRDVPVTDRALPVIRARLAKAKSKGGYLFPLRVGTGSDYSQAMTDLHHAHERALKASRIKPRFRVYDLRHTYGTRQVEAGTDPLTLAKLMGHADLKTTQRYVHLSKRHLAEAQTRLEHFRTVREIQEAEVERRALPMQ
jgi:integrase